MRTNSTDSPEYGYVLKLGAQTRFKYDRVIRYSAAGIRDFQRYFGFSYPGSLGRDGGPDDKEEFEFILNEYSDMFFSYQANKRLHDTNGALTQVVMGAKTSNFGSVNTPGFKRKRAAGKIINNPFSKGSGQFLYGINPARGDLKFNVVRSYFGWTGSGSKYGISIRGYADVDNVDFSGVGITKGAHGYLQSIFTRHSMDPSQDALSQANSNLRSADLDAIVNAIELKSTVRTLVDGGRRIASLAMSIKKGRFFKTAPKAWRKYKRELAKGKAVRPEHFAADAWLEARYAWRPIMYDVNGALKVLNGDEPASTRQTFRGRSQQSSNDSIPINYTDSATGFRYSGSLERSISIVSRAGIIGDARVSSTSIPKKLGLFNVLDAGWDLVPYSFVVDWFIDVSWIISKLNPTVAYIPRASWSTNETEIIVQGEVEVTAPDGTKKNIQVGYSGKQKVRTPNPEPQLIRLSVNLNFLKAIDMAALFRAR